jgi:hypothetical protein
MRKDQNSAAGLRTSQARHHVLHLSRRGAPRRAGYGALDLSLKPERSKLLDEVVAHARLRR